jgi:hypothetical protein
MFEYLETVTSQTAGLFRSGLPRLAETTPSSNAASRGFGPIVLVGLLLACGVVAFWRAVLAICAIACLVLFFIGILAVMSGAQNILRHASGDESPAVIQPAALTIRWPQPRIALARGNAMRPGPSATLQAVTEARILIYRCGFLQPAQSASSVPASTVRPPEARDP